jgi:hypothetical protein
MSRDSSRHRRWFDPWTAWGGSHDHLFLDGVPLQLEGLNVRLIDLYELLVLLKDP